MRRSVLISLAFCAVAGRALAHDQDSCPCPSPAAATSAGGQPDAPASRAEEPASALPPALPAVSPSAAPSSSRASMIGLELVLVVLAALLGAALLAVVVWFALVQPRRKRRPFLQAMAVVRRKDAGEGELEEAERQLTQALASGLPAGDVSDARFAQAWIRAWLGRHAEAQGVVADLRRSGETDRATIYLDLWLRSKSDDHEEVRRIFDEHGARLTGWLDAELAASISYLHQARVHWDRREIDAAIRSFERVRELGKLAGEIPARIDNQQLVLGITALFEKTYEEARKHFEGALEWAKKSGRSTLQAELCLLLTEWMKEESPDVDDRLGKLVEQLPEDPGEARLVRGVLLWHAVSRLFVWLRLPANQGLPPAELDVLYARLQKVKDAAPDLGDPYLIEGLVRSWLDERDGARAAGERALKAALEHEVRVPEVQRLVDRAERLAAEERKALENFIELVGKYLKDGGVPREHREALRARLARYSRFKSVAQHDFDDKDDRSSAPSLKDVESRGQLLFDRVTRLVKPRLDRAQDSAGAHALEQLLGSLEQATKALGEQQKTLEQTERELMLSTGEFLIREEEHTEAKP